MVKTNEAYEYICLYQLGQELLMANSNANAAGEAAKSKEIASCVRNAKVRE